jgi:plasmid stabilization system protein ParE
MREVVLSKQAADKLEKLLKYLETQWSESVKQSFIIKFDDSVKAITLFPESTEKSNLKKKTASLRCNKANDFFLSI